MINHTKLFRLCREERHAVFSLAGELSRISQVPHGMSEWQACKAIDCCRITNNTWRAAYDLPVQKAIGKYLHRWRRHLGRLGEIIRIRMLCLTTRR